MRANDVKVGEVYVLRPPASWGTHYGRRPHPIASRHVQGARDPRHYAPTDEEYEVASRHACIVLSVGERIPFTSEANGIAVAHALYHPRFRKDAEWSFHIVPARNIVQLYKHWVKDVTPIVAAARKVATDELAEQKRKQKEREAKLRRESKTYAEQKRKQAAQQKESQAKETRLRTVLHNYGINDSDGWRGVMTKTRVDSSGKGIVTTYVRHLDLEDVLRLTGGREEPPAKTAQRVSAAQKGKGKSA